MTRNLSTASIFALLTIVDRGVEDMTMIARRSYHTHPDQSAIAYKMRDEIQCWLTEAVTLVTDGSDAPGAFSLSLEPAVSSAITPGPSLSSSS